MELEAALKESMKTFAAEDAGRGGGDGGDGGMVGSVLNAGRGAAEEQKEPAFKAFQGQGRSLGGGAAAA